MPAGQGTTLDEVPPLRRGGVDQDDGLDGKRISYMDDLWQSQSWALRERDKQVEENVRMLSGQQWMVYSDLLGRWKDLSEVLNDDEERWRQRPVINKLLYWYMITHARMTENQPVVAFSPSTGDRSDARLAEALDTVHKSLWDQLSMSEKIDQFVAWLIPGGSAYFKTRVDLDAGSTRPWIAPYTTDGPNGQPVHIPAAPFDRGGNALVELVDGGDGYRATGEPFREREGEICVDVLPPLAVRGQWGSNIPWREKSWHMHRALLTPEEVFDRWGIEVEPNVYGHDEEGTGELHQLLFGSGYFGGVDNEPGAWGEGETGQGYVQVDELWMTPSGIREGMKATDDSPGGRLMIRVGEKIARDGPRPAHFEGPSPIQKCTFVNVPGRPDGTSPQEMLNPLQRTFNRGVAQQLEHRNLVTNPMAVIDSQSGIEEEQLTNKPGLVIKNVNRRKGVPALEFIKPPPLSQDVYRTQQFLDEQMLVLGNMAGARGSPPTQDASGKLVQELRFNSDRFLGPTMRRLASTLEHVVEDINTLLPLVWDRKKVIAYAGDDNVARTTTVFPEMFEQGSVDVKIATESLLPESRQAKQDKIWKMYQAGLFGEPGSPEARRRFFDLAQFPHMDRATKPGGIDRITAQRENGKLVQGIPHDEIPVLQTYDHQTHVAVHKKFINSPDFLQQPRRVQWGFMLHMKAHLEYLEQAKAQAAEEEAALMQMMSEAQGEGGLGGAPGPQSPAREIEQRRDQRAREGRSAVPGGQPGSGGAGPTQQVAETLNE